VTDPSSEVPRVALVTGAGGGMGSAISRRLAADGFRVVGVELVRERLDPLIAELGEPHRGYVADITSEEEISSIVEDVARTIGAPQVLVHTVGWTGTTRFVEEDSAYWRKLVDVNYFSFIYVVSRVVPLMIERGGGRIVAITSDAAKVGQSNEAVYAGCKAAVVALGKSLARELARHGILVNCVSPGPTDTGLAELEAETTARILRYIPLRRLATPDDQAAAVAFLCSDAAGYITGQVLSVSGGLTMT
jgi:2-hydroxycyclohexanecarboxyl-CoA dehydrogenase